MRCDFVTHDDLQRRLERACEEIVGLKRELDDARTVERFWRACAEQALRLWERAQDEIDERDERALERDTLS